MNVSRSLFAASALFALAAAPSVQAQTGSAPPANAQTANSATAKASLVNAEGKNVGAATFEQTPRGVLIRLSINGLPAGERAMHIHAVGKCEAPFTSAGGHFNPDNRKHGLHAADGSHAGDMPNIHVGADSTVTVEVLNAAVTLEQGKPNSLIRDGGTALVIHQGKDDYKTDPTGDAGGRIACGVIQ